MKIRAVRVRGVAAPMKRPLVTSIATVGVAPLLLIDLETDAGVTGRSYLFALAKHHLEHVRHGLFDDEPGRRRALLPARAESPGHDLIDGEVEVGVSQYDRGVLAAHLRLERRTGRSE